MDAGGLALPDDLVSMSECKHLPLHAITRQISLRDREIGSGRSGAHRHMLQHEIVRLHNMSREAQLKLALNHNSSFVVLADNGFVQTCYNDRAGTSRSAACTIEELVEFAKDVLRKFAPDSDDSAK